MVGISAQRAIYLPGRSSGASLMYEQYYGDEVGLFGKISARKTLMTISAEVTYTPVPLLTLSAGHKQGKSGENDTRFGLEVNYRIGEPLEKQLDTDSIHERRMLQAAAMTWLSVITTSFLSTANLK